MIRPFYTLLITAIILSVIAPNANAQNRDYYALHDIPVEKRIAPTETRASLIRGASPFMPPTANRSGYCCMAIDIAKDGLPQNIKTSYCTSKVFKKPSIRSTKYWRFAPAVIDGHPVSVNGQIHLVSFMLKDQRGNFLPDKQSTMLVNGKVDLSYKRLCMVPDIS